MMYKIANLLKDEIKNLNFVEVAAGLAKPVQVKQNVRGTVREGSLEERTGEAAFEVDIKVVPMAIRDTVDPCDSSDLLHLVPDTTKLSIHWWEDNGTEPTNEDTFYIHSQASLRLVSWWNLPLIDSSMTDPGLLVANLISNIPDYLDNVDYLTQIRVSFDGEEPGGAGIVSQYSFDEPENQFTTYPYFITGLNYIVDFAFAKNCVSAVTLNPSVCP